MLNKFRMVDVPLRGDNNVHAKPTCDIVQIREALPFQKDLRVWLKEPHDASDSNLVEHAVEPGNRFAPTTVADGNHLHIIPLLRTTQRCFKQNGGKKQAGVTKYD